MEMSQIVDMLCDSNFQSALSANPYKTLQEAGVAVSATTEVKVVRNSKNSINVVLPANKEEGEALLSDDELAQLAAGEGAIALLGIVALASVVVGGIVGGAYGIAALVDAV